MQVFHLTLVLIKLRVCRTVIVCRCLEFIEYLLTISEVCSITLLGIIKKKCF